MRIAWRDSKSALGAEVSQGGGVGRAAPKHFLELIAGLTGPAEFGKGHGEVDASFDQVRLQADSVAKLLHRGGIVSLTAQCQAQAGMGFG